MCSINSYEVTYKVPIVSVSSMGKMSMSVPSRENAIYQTDSEPSLSQGNVSL